MRLNKPLYLCMIIILFIICINKGNATPKLKIAVIDLTYQAELSDEANLVRDMLELMLFKQTAFQVLEREHVDIVLKQKGINRKNCSDIECTAKIGRELSADIVLVSKISKASSYIINYKLVKTSNNAILSANYKKAHRKDQLEDKAIQIIQEIKDTYKKITDKYYTIENSHTILISLGGFIPHEYSFADSSESLALSIALFKNNQFFHNFSIGLQYEYISYTYEDVVTNETSKEESSSNSLLVSIHYAFIFSINRTFSFKVYPAFSCGLLFNSTKTSTDTYSSIEESSREFNRTIIYKPGLMGALLINNKFEIFTGLEYITNFKQHNTDYRGYKLSLGLLYHI